MVESKWQILNHIGCEVGPIQEVCDLLAPNPQRDLQRLCALHPLAKARVETEDSLLDEPEMERCGIDYCLNVCCVVDF